MRKKYYFILNPAAGQGKALDLRDSIEEIAKKPIWILKYMKLRKN